MKNSEERKKEREKSGRTKEPTETNGEYRKVPAGGPERARDLVLRGKERGGTERTGPD